MRRLFFSSHVTTQSHALLLARGFVSERRIYKEGRFLTPSQGCPNAISKNASQLVLAEQLRKNIIYHAAWHTHLFFLVLIAAYQKKYVMTLERTEEQHGRGVNNQIQACHSSFLPHYTSFNVNQKSPARFVAHTRKSFLNHWNNMTVCCPSITNDLDSFIEIRYRDTLIAILTAVSLNALTPDQGLTQYFKVMHISFLQTQQLIEKQKNLKTRTAAQKVIGLQRYGLFQHANKNFTPRNSYIRHVLNVKRGQCLFKGYRALQATLLSSPENSEKQKELLSRLKRMTKPRF